MGIDESSDFVNNHEMLLAILWVGRSWLVIHSYACNFSVDKGRLFVQAQSSPLENYMIIQTDATPQMRGLLINWLIEVGA